MSINPDFTKVALPDHPSCSYDEWKKNLEEKMGGKSGHFQRTEYYEKI